MWACPMVSTRAVPRSARSSRANALYALVNRFTGMSSRRATASHRAYWTRGSIRPRSRGRRAAMSRISREEVMRMPFI